MGNWLLDFMFLFNLMLFLQLYSFHKLTVEASQRESLTTCAAESYHQNGSNIANERSRGNHQRPKRPARLMPVQLLMNEDEDETPKTKNITRFYGPANSCAEIAKLGYTLNGYYLIRGNSTSTNSQIEVLGCRFKHVDGSKEAKEENVGLIDIEISANKSVRRRSIQSTMETNLESIDNILFRQRRPVRLLPARMFREEEKNKTGNQNAANARFYGPATSCDELGKLGYSLNGLYLVDCKENSHRSKKIEVVVCQFKQPSGSKEVKEERLGFINIEVKKTKAPRRRSLNELKKRKKLPASESDSFLGLQKRPARILPFHLFYKKEKNDTEENKMVKRFYGLPSNCSELVKLGYTLNGYYLVNGTNSKQIEVNLCRFQQPPGSNETTKEEIFDLVTYIDKQDIFDTSSKMVYTPTGKRKYVETPLDDFIYGESYMLMNKHGKCLEPENKNNGSQVIQAVCNPLSPYHLWRFLNWELGFPLFLLGRCGVFNSSNYFTLYRLIKDVCAQGRYYWSVKNSSQITYKNSCLAVEGDSSAVGSKAILAPCDNKQKGQIWSFITLDYNR